MTRKNPHSGHGLLDGFLAILRGNYVNKQIKEDFRSGKLLDIGCGRYPFFLLKVRFHEKFGIDQFYDKSISSELKREKINLLTIEFNPDTFLPFDDNSFDIITSLAVVEHLTSETLMSLLMETYRILKPGGNFILTTPSRWSAPVLKFLTFFGLVSKTEVADHKILYTKKSIYNVITSSGFKSTEVQVEYFECFMNIGVIAKK